MCSLSDSLQRFGLNLYSESGDDDDDNVLRCLYEIGLEHALSNFKTYLFRRFYYLCK